MSDLSHIFRNINNIDASVREEMWSELSRRGLDFSHVVFHPDKTELVSVGLVSAQTRNSIIAETLRTLAVIWDNYLEDVDRKMSTFLHEEADRIDPVRIVLPDPNPSCPVVSCLCPMMLFDNENDGGQFYYYKCMSGKHHFIVRTKSYPSIQEAYDEAVLLSKPVTGG